VTVPVIAMSASPTLLGQAMREGAPAALAKPFELQQMQALVASYCSPPAR
jgi:DNA-binding NtrC family response regulator